jgi:hypothetical protein
MLISKIIFSLLPEKNNLVLILDRTNWQFGDKNINILMLGVSYKNVAFPLMFRMLDKRGNSNTQERIALVEDFISYFGKDVIDCLLADREFIGEDWLNFLNTNGIRYHIRIRNNFKIFNPRKQKEMYAWHLFNSLKIGQIRHYPKIVKMHGEYCYISGIKTIKDGKLDFCLIVFSTSFGATTTAGSLIKLVENWLNTKNAISRNTTGITVPWMRRAYTFTKRFADNRNLMPFYSPGMIFYLLIIA